jgi:glycosyltransferase involved in cell wall biosynthesis
VRILLAGMLAGTPGHGGATWAILQWVRGLERLGHEVLVVEPVERIEEPAAAYFRTLELPRAALLRAGTRETLGVPYERIAAFGADLLLNMSGLLRDPELTAGIRVRAFVDLDPVFVQLWHAEGVDVGLGGHTRHVTVGQDLAHAGIPLDRRWIATLPPVVLEQWPVAGRVEHDAFTTVGNWRSYGSVEHDGAHYGQKAHAVRRLLDLPRLAPAPLLPALAIDPGEAADLDALRAHGWQLADPAAVAATPDAYRRFVSGSKGELGLAKAGYVDARCGWFSDRSACYLAAGRPVVAHDTGFGCALPVGEGLLAFATAQEAARAIGVVCGDYERHRTAARAIAEQHLDSDVVLGRLLERIL